MNYFIQKNMLSSILIVISIVSCQKDNEDSKNSDKTDKSPENTLNTNKESVPQKVETKVKLVGSQVEKTDLFGYSANVSGNIIAASAIFDDGEGNAVKNSGAVYVFEKDTAGKWAETAVLRASNPGEEDDFGYSVSVGTGIVTVGAKSEDHENDSMQNSGAVYIFTKTAEGKWEETQILRATAPTSNAYFGASVQISGKTIVVGSPKNKPNENPGQAIVFENKDGQWQETTVLQASDKKEGTLDFFGRTVSIDKSGNNIIVGAPRTNSADDSLERSGSAYIFARTGDGWGEKSVLRASNAEAHDAFGTSVSITDNNVAVGALRRYVTMEGDDSKYRSGSVYIFEKNNSNEWSEEAMISPKAPNTDDHFGISVSLNGQSILVGADYDDSIDNEVPQSGSAYLFKQDKDKWVQKSIIAPDKPRRGNHYGFSVSMDDKTMVMGAITWDADDDNNQGGFIEVINRAE